MSDCCHYWLCTVCDYDTLYTCLVASDTDCTESCYGCECVTMTYVCFRHKRLVALSHVMVVSLLL